MALVRVRYVAIRKSKTCSGSFGSRAGILSKYVILNCWNRLPQKSSRVNVNLSGRGPSILLRKTVLSLIAIQLFNATATTLNCISQICWLNVALISCLAIKAPLELSLLRSTAQTRTFENTPLSAGCKKTQEKLWQKERARGLVLLICFLPTVPGTVPAPHPPARRKCPPGCDTCRPARPDWPLPGTR